MSPGGRKGTVLAGILLAGWAVGVPVLAGDQALLKAQFLGGVEIAPAEARSDALARTLSDVQAGPSQGETRQAFASRLESAALPLGLTPEQGIAALDLYWKREPRQAAFSRGGLPAAGRPLPETRAAFIMGRARELAEALGATPESGGPLGHGGASADSAAATGGWLAPGLETDASRGAPDPATSGQAARPPAVPALDAFGPELDFDGARIPAAPRADGGWASPRDALALLRRKTLTLLDSLLNLLPQAAGDWARRRVDYYGLKDVKSGDWTGYGRSLESGGGAIRYTGNTLDFLVDDEVLPRFLDDIGAAKRSIDLQAFQFEACAYESGPKGAACDRGADVGWRVARLLAAKAKQGVRVRLLMDQFGTQNGADRKELDALLAFLKANGVEWAFHDKPLLVDHLDHRKLYVIDGRIGWVGGMNIGNDYQVYWHDQLARVEGPAVLGLQDAFLDKWREAGREVPAEELPGLLPDAAPIEGGIDLWLVPHEGGFWSDKYIKRAYLQAIATAQRSVRIADPYLSDPDILAAAREAASRGVKVQLVVPARNDEPILQRAERGFYPDLIRAGVEVYEYGGRPMAHDKVAVVDGRWATFGSSNLDNRSLEFNDELNVFLLDPRLDGVAREIETKLFDADVKNSRRVLGADLAQRSWLKSLRERLDAVLEFLI